MYTTDKKLVKSVAEGGNKSIIAWENTVTVYVIDVRYR